MRKAISAASRRHPGRVDSGAISGAPGDAIEARWTCNRLSTTPADRAAAEQGVRMAYRAVGLSPPRIVWHDGPVSLAASWASASFSMGANTSDAVIATPYRHAVRRLAMQADCRLTFVRDRFGCDCSCAVSAAVRAAVIEEVRASRTSLRTRLWRLTRSVANMSWPPRFADSGWSQHELCWLGFTASLLETLGLHAVTELRGLLLVAENAGWILPHADVCLLSDRPVALSFDRWGRLHCPYGAALRYRDGWSVHAWKGARVPSWLIDEPQRITLSWIDAQIDPQARRAMIEIVTPERFIEAGGADCVASDEAGTLWRRKWTHRGVVIDTWTAVEPRRLRRNSVKPPDRRVWYVPEEVRSPAEAIACIFGPRAECPREAPTLSDETYLA